MPGSPLFPVVWELLNKPSILNKLPTPDFPSCKLFAESVLTNKNKPCSHKHRGPALPHEGHLRTEITNTTNRGCNSCIWSFTSFFQLLIFRAASHKNIVAQVSSSCCTTEVQQRNLCEQEFPYLHFGSCCPYPDKDSPASLFGLFIKTY